MSHDSMSTYKVTPYQRDHQANSGDWIHTFEVESTHYKSSQPWLGMLLLVLIAKIVNQNMISYNGII